MPPTLRTALIVVDVQNDFCEGGSLAVAGGSAVAARISDLLRQDHGYAAVVGTLDWHISPGSHFAPEPDYVDTWPVHCVAGTEGARSHPDLDTTKIHPFFRKGLFEAAYSGFQGHADVEGATVPTRDTWNGDEPGDDEEVGLDLTAWLRGERIEAVDVVGIATDHCVRATALDAAAAGLATRVLLDLTAGVAPATTELALVRLREAGVELVGGQELRDVADPLG